MDRNGIHIFARVAGFALIAGVVLGVMYQIWWFAIICAIAFVVVAGLEVTSFVKRRRQIREGRG